MFRALRFTLCALLAAGLCGLVSQANAGDKDFKDLFNGKDLSGWKFVPEKGGDKVFTVKDGMVVVAGKPNGYFYTDKSYKNYVLRYDWKFSNDKPGSNSGLLVHITGPHKVWPKCVEVQGAQGDHGNIFAIGGAKGSFKKDAAAQKKAIKLGDWNTTEVTVKDGMMTSKINGIEVCTGKAEGVTEGPFGFQSEGTELYFKNIKIKVLD